MGRNMLLKRHFLHSRLEFFPENMGKVFKGYGENFCKDTFINQQDAQNFCY